MNKEYKTFEELKEELGDKFEEFMYKVNIELLEKVNQLETNRDEAIEEIKDLLEHWKGNDLVERDLNVLLTMLDEVGGSNE